MIALIAVTEVATAQAWRPDARPGQFRNPVIFADYSDPDVIRDGNDFWLTASSFESVPALPILHSTDLVHWTIVNHAIRRLGGEFNTPQHGNGVWAPSIRKHAGWFYIYYGDPDRGIYMVRTRDPRGTWEAPVLVREAKGWIDPCPLWDDDGNAYLVHAFANSRAGIKSVLHVNRMSPDGTRLLDDGVLVFDGRANHPTIEGPKFYKRNGWYYIFAPAGGVPTGWQTVLRSRSPLGPYEDRIVMRQGSTSINGPHQGGWMHLASGEDWFMHFQDREAAGRVVHLQPMTWRSDDWPVIGADPDGDGVGEPVIEHAMPRTTRTSLAAVPQTSDDFSSATRGLQWQWQANDSSTWSSLTAHRGWLRLYARNATADLWTQPNVLFQKFPGPRFTATTRISLSDTGNVTAGLTILGTNYAFIAAQRAGDRMRVVYATATDVMKGAREELITTEDTGPSLRSGRQMSVGLRVSCTETQCTFAYNVRGTEWESLGVPFAPKPGRWVGAKVGLFSRGAGYADFDYLRVQ